MDAVAELRPRQGFAATRDRAKRSSRAISQLTGNRAVGHAAAVERIRRHPGPDHDPVGQRIAGGDTEPERIGGEYRVGPDLARRRQG